MSLSSSLVSDAHSWLRNRCCENFPSEERLVDGGMSLWEGAMKSLIIGQMNEFLKFAICFQEKHDAKRIVLSYCTVSKTSFSGFCLLLPVFCVSRGVGKSFKIM